MYCLWLTGKPCSGKSTIAYTMAEQYFHPSPIVLDGDAVRETPLANDAGFSVESRRNHILRMGYLASMFVEKGIPVICSFVSPCQRTRLDVRSMFEEDKFFEIYVKASRDKRIERDVKGMYAKAIRGEISNFTGYNSPYDVPRKPELVLDTENMSVEECIKEILKII